VTRVFFLVVKKIQVVVVLEDQLYFEHEPGMPHHLSRVDYTASTYY
jgi:hypothetical protein